MRWDLRGAQEVEGTGLPWTDPVEDSHMEDTRRPCVEVDTRGTVGNRDMVDMQPCAGAFHKVLPRIPVVVDIPEVEWRHLPPEEILHGIRGVVEEDNRMEVVVLAYMGEGVRPGDVLLPVADVVVAAAAAADDDAVVVVAAAAVAVVALVLELLLPLLALMEGALPLVEERSLRFLVALDDLFLLISCLLLVAAKRNFLPRLLLILP